MFWWFQYFFRISAPFDVIIGTVRSDSHMNDTTLTFIICLNIMFHHIFTSLMWLDILQVFNLSLLLLLDPLEEEQSSSFNLVSL